MCYSNLFDGVRETSRAGVMERVTRGTQVLKRQYLASDHKCVEEKQKVVKGELYTRCFPLTPDILCLAKTARVESRVSVGAQRLISGLNKINILKPDTEKLEEKKSEKSLQH